MSRILKFRAWDKGLKKYSKIATKNKIEDINFLTDYEWEQFTGIPDKKNNEIYEGDILKINGRYFHAVIFENGCFGTDCYSDFDALSLQEDYEIVGNIHENPDILLNME